MAVIITDSTCDLPLGELDALHIPMMSLKVNIGGRAYADKRELTDEEFYRLLDTQSELPTTTLISIGEFLDVYAAYPDEEIVVITLSSNMSGTYQSAVAAAEMAGRKNIFVVDSQTVTGPLGLLVKQAARLRDEGKTGAQIAAQIESLKSRVRLVAMIDTLKYLVKGGRISGVTGAVGTVLGIKPIITLRDGLVVNLSKCRGVPASIEELIRLTREDYPLDPAMPVCFAHTNNETGARQLMKAMGREDCPDVYMIGSVVGTHAGPGAFAVCYFERQ